MGGITWTLVAIVIGLVAYVLNIFRLKLNFWKDRGIPHDKPHFLYGSLARTIKEGVHFNYLIREIYAKYKLSGPFCGMHLFFTPACLLTDLDLIKNVLIRDFNKFPERGLFYNEKDDPLSTHLFSLNAAKWKPLRAKLSPTFTSGKMKFMLPTVVQVGEQFARVVDEEQQKHPVMEIRDFCARYTTDVIGTCAFGIECNSLKDPDSEFRRYGKRIFTDHRHPVLLEGLIMAFPQLARRLRMRMTHEQIHKFFMRVVRETVEYREKNNVQRNDFMHLLLEMRCNDELNGLTIDEIAGQMFIFFLGGFETSSSTMGFALYELALNQNVQDRLRQEILETFERHDQKLTYDFMKDMPYMKMVINETLRKYPIVNNLVRKSMKDYRSMNLNFTIPKDCMVLVPIDAIHFDPKYYPDPDVFDPERFTPEEIQKRHPLAWLPFGDGPRNCIGKRFGLMQIIVGLTLLLRNFRFRPCPETPIPIKFDIKSGVLSPEGGIPLQVERV